MSDEEDYFTDTGQWQYYLKPPPGTNIWDVAKLVLKPAARRSTLLAGLVFNGVIVSNFEATTVEELVDRYNKGLEGNRQHG